MPTSPPARSGGSATGDAAGLERLMEALRDDDPDALGELLELFWEPLVRYASRLLHNVDDASDVVQDCFVRLWKGRHERHRSGSVRAFLYRAVRNRALDERRKADRRSRWALEARRMATRTPPPRPDELLAERELLATIERAVGDLPPRRREVFLLAHVHDLSYREIAEVLEISPQTAANHLCAALGYLRTALSDELRDSDAPEDHRLGSTPGPDIEHG